MTVTVSEGWQDTGSTEELAERIEALVARRRDLTLDEQYALRQALAQPCGPRPTGCMARPGEECVSLHDGGPLVRQLFHDVRRKAAGIEYVPTSEQELKGLPKKLSETARAQKVREATGQDLPGYHEGKSWGRSTAAEDQGWG